MQKRLMALTKPKSPWQGQSKQTKEFGRSHQKYATHSINDQTPPNEKICYAVMPFHQRKAQEIHRNTAFILLPLERGPDRTTHVTIPSLDTCLL